MIFQKYMLILCAMSLLSGPSSPTIYPTNSMLIDNSEIIDESSSMIASSSSSLNVHTTPSSDREEKEDSGGLDLLSVIIGGVISLVGTSITLAFTAWNAEKERKHQSNEAEKARDMELKKENSIYKRQLYTDLLVSMIEYNKKFNDVSNITEGSTDNNEELLSYGGAIYEKYARALMIMSPEVENKAKHIVDSIDPNGVSAILETEIKNLAVSMKGDI